MSDNNSSNGSSNGAAPPLTIVFFGKTGAGKSSTLNRLFGLSFKTDNSVACTKAPQFADLERAEHPDLPHERVRVVDLPGIGETVRADRRYARFYEEWVAKADSLVWVTQADTRAYKRDEIFLLKLAPFFKPRMRLTVALNRVDDFAAEEGAAPFDTARREPSAHQLSLLPEKIRDVRGVFEGAVSDGARGREIEVVPYTAFYGWGLQTLKQRIMLKG